MDRRQFLGLMAALAAGATPAAARRLSTADRLTWWDPAPTGGFPPIVLEWRYLAGRIAEGEQDYGFVVSLADYNPPLSDPPQLLVMRQELRGGLQRITRTYPGAIAYSTATATYTFTAAENPAVAATWRLDTATQTYTLDVASPELTLDGLTLAPVGELIPEAGTGRITTARLAGANVRSDYYADWVELRRGAASVGYGRLDMQTIEPTDVPGSTDFGFSHHWFAVAGQTADGPVWITAWRLSSEVTTWVATVARGAVVADWEVASISEQTAGVAFPVTVSVLDWQEQPVGQGEPPRRTGSAWRVTAGRSVAGDLLDLTIGVAPGQFIAGARVASGLTRIPAMQEAITLDASGSVEGQALRSVSFAVAESTFSEDARTFMPGIAR